MDTFAQRIDQVRERIARAAARAGKPTGSIQLVAVTKKVDPDRVAEAVAAGITDLGENYVQEARQKQALLDGQMPSAVRWHLIGHLQSNKAKYSVELFSLIHSVDSYQLAQELGKQASKKEKIQPVLVEVKLAKNASRAGVSPEAALEVVEQIAHVPGVAVHGLMGIPPMGERAEDAREYFAQLRALFERLPADQQKVLSMGMSGDYQVAIEEGATLVRLGTALFGRRGE